MVSRMRRNLKEGIKNLSRNKLFTFASVATMSLCIFLIGIFFAIGFNIMTILKEVESTVPMTVYFEKETTLEQQKEVQNKINASPKVKETKFITAEEAWEKYKSTYFKDYPKLAEGFKDDNPLANYATIEVYLNNIDDQNQFAQEIRNMSSIVRKVNHSADVANKLSSFNYAFIYTAVAVICLLIFIAIFLISNTVSLGIAIRKEEIHIMQYVGAKDKFIRGPFVTEGVIIGILGVIIPLFLEYLIYSKALQYVSQHLEVLSTTNTFVPVNTIFVYFTPIALAIGLLLGYCSSRITISRFLCR